MYKIKYNKYIDKLMNNKMYYHFNSYGKRVPDKYNMMLNILSNFINITRINDIEHTHIKNKFINLTNDYYVKTKLIIGSSSIILTLLNDNSIINIILTDQNSCYIETFIYSACLSFNFVKIAPSFFRCKIATFSSNSFGKI